MVGLILTNEELTRLCTVQGVEQAWPFGVCPPSCMLSTPPLGYGHHVSSAFSRPN